MLRALLVFRSEIRLQIAIQSPAKMPSGIASETGNFGLLSEFSPPLRLGNCKWGGAKRIVRCFGGGECTIECPLQNFGGLRKRDLSDLCPFPPKKMTWREQMGVGKRIIGGGGVRNRFWGGVLRYVFPSPEFSTPPCFSLMPIVLP